MDYSRYYKILSKERLYKKWIKNKENENFKQQYKNYENCLNKVITAAKLNFERKEFEKISNNKKKMWDFINRKINGAKNNKDKNVEYLTVNKKNIHNEENIAEAFNEFFSKVASNLAKKIKKT